MAQRASPTGARLSATENYYRRPLPEGLVAFASLEGRALFREALAAGGMEGWFPLAEHFHTQSEPPFCALGSLVVVLNALAIDPGRTWKGPWRYGWEQYAST
jgi:glutathione gamma-glutamylcysteinyltransferase